MAGDSSALFGFVVLHYLVDESTVRCVESIRRYCAGYDHRIVIVDNDSANGSLERLRGRYAGADDVTVLHNAANEGFARGNNYGYRYCMERLHCDYIVTINNDAELCDARLIPASMDDYERLGSAVVGPRIISGKDGHDQNPVRSVVDSMARVRAMRKHIRRNLLLLRLHLLGPLKAYQAHKSPPKPQVATERPAPPEGTYKLHGACLIFTPAFLHAFDEPFDPGTFLYLEEDILCIRCRRAGLTMHYDPRIEVLHEQDVSVDAVAGHDERTKQIQYLLHHRESLKVLSRYLEDPDNR